MARSVDLPSCGLHCLHRFRSKSNLEPEKLRIYRLLSSLEGHILVFRSVRQRTRDVRRCWHEPLEQIQGSTLQLTHRGGRKISGWLHGVWQQLHPPYNLKKPSCDRNRTLRLTRCSWRGPVRLDQGGLTVGRSLLMGTPQRRLNF